MSAAVISKVTLLQISPDGEECLRCQQLVVPEISYAEIDPSCSTNTYLATEYQIAGVVTVDGVICAACVDAERQSSLSDCPPRSESDCGADELTTPVGPAYLSQLRPAIADALRGGVDDMNVHRDANDPIEDLFTAGTLGLLRLVAVVGEQICRSAERAISKPCDLCGQPTVSPSTHRRCEEREAFEASR